MAALRKTKAPVTMFLVKGVKLQGIVTWFDNFSILLRRDGQSQLVYKHAISTIMPGAPMDATQFESQGQTSKQRLLQDVFLSRVSEREGKPLVGISAAAVKRLLAYAWPGNVRELANLLERAVSMTDHDTIVPENLDLPRSSSTIEDLLGSGSSGKLPLAEVERAYVRRVVEDHDGNKAAAAWR